MAGHWEFNEADPSSVRIDLTQWDQFNNDVVGLAEALVREVIQNSLDAATGEGPVKVIFGLKALNGKIADLLEKKFDDLRPHLKACALDFPMNGNSSARVLAIEDFNTRGLTGSFDHWDGGDFDNFWRAVGKSKKSGQEGGRWGLGKIVYSASSQVRSFFGLTFRTDDHVLAIMGQAVLTNHESNGVYYPAHGFWFGKRSSNQLKLQLPVQNANEIDAFRELFGIRRTNQPGLSVLIPYLIDDITEDTILSGVINNYYFPILAGKLEVEVGDTHLDAHTFLDTVSDINSKNSNVPLTFIKEISESILSQSAIAATQVIGNVKFSPEKLPAEQIDALKAAFFAGELARLRVPVALQRKDGTGEIGKIDLILKDLDEGEKPFSLFARGAITLPNERRYFAGAYAHGAMIAHDDVVVEFLGDAENPAHTGWNTNAEKLNSRWKNAGKSLAAVRHSLRQLYQVIADQSDKQDDNALINFFSLPKKAQSLRGKRKSVIKPKPEIPPREVAIRIKPAIGGFEIKPGPGTKNWSYPRRIRLRLAYDIVGSDPFKSFSVFDFDLITSKYLELEATNGNIRIMGPNRLYFDVREPNFHLRISGFDTRRDLIVDARAL